MSIALFDINQTTPLVRDFIRPICVEAVQIMIANKADIELIESVLTLPDVITLNEDGTLTVPAAHELALESLEYGSSTVPVMLISKKVGNFLKEKMEVSWRA